MNRSIWKVKRVTFKLIRLRENNLPVVYQFFENEDFYFASKRPNTLSENKIRQIVLENALTSYIFYSDDKPIGILSFRYFEVDNKSTVMQFRCLDMQLVLGNAQNFKNMLLNYISGNNPSIKFVAYDFDETGKEFAHMLSFNTEAILKEHVFKAGKYYDVLIFSKDLY
jgi:hypothetical protein